MVLTEEGKVYFWRKQISKKIQYNITCCDKFWISVKSECHVELSKRAITTLLPFIMCR